MENSARYRWSECEYSLQQFIDKFKRHLPVLIRTTTGFSGYDGSMHEIGADEVFWIFGVQEQQRVLAMDEEDRYVSIPVKYQRRVQKVNKNGTHSCPVSLEHLVHDKEDRQPFVFETGSSCAFDFGTTIPARNRSNFGVLTIIDLYSEKYLLTHSIFEDYLHQGVVGIPVYMPISINVAEGFVNGTAENFKEWTQSVICLGSSVRENMIQPCKDILLFEHLPEGDYEYVHPQSFVKDSVHESSPVLNPVTKSALPTKISSGTQSGKLYYSTPLAPILCATAAEAEHWESVVPQLSLSPLNKLPVAEPRYLLPQSPVLPPKSPKPKRPAGDVDKSWKTHGAPRRLQLSISQTPTIQSPIVQPPISHSLNLQSPISQLPDLSTNEPQNRSLASPPVEFSRPRFLPAFKQTQSSAETVHEPAASASASIGTSGNLATPTPDNVELRCRKTSNGDGYKYSPLVKRSSSLILLSEVCREPRDSWKSFDDVPTDITKLSVEQIGHCLLLLGMKEYVKAFRDNLIDGPLLMNLSEEIIIKDLNVRSLDARKLMMFANKGWRPKMM